MEGVFGVSKKHNLFNFREGRGPRPQLLSLSVGSEGSNTYTVSSTLKMEAIFCSETSAAYPTSTLYYQQKKTLNLVYVLHICSLYIKPGYVVKEFVLLRFQRFKALLLTLPQCIS
jgi:hypothetical protein